MRHMMVHIKFQNTKAQTLTNMFGVCDLALQTKILCGWSPTHKDFIITYSKRDKLLKVQTCHI